MSPMIPGPTRVPFCLAVILVVAAGARIRCQCSTQWLPGHGMPGTDGDVTATTMWDPDGAGPQLPVLVVGGLFQLAGSAVASNIATYDPVSGIWSALGTGMNERVYALTTLPNGDLVAGGQFTTAGGVPASNIALWDGASWSPLGTGMNTTVGALITLPNGDLVAGGFFTSAGGVSASRIARWNGTSWSALGSGMNGRVGTLTTLANGDLVAGGSFTTAGGVSANSIASWDDPTWSPLGAGTNGLVYSLTVLPNGDLVAGGSFSSAGAASASNIARTNGATWSALGSGVNNAVFALTALLNGDPVAGGGFIMAGGVASAYLARLTTTCPATTASFGAGCAGSAGPNVLTATSLPWTGSTFTSVATGMPAISLALSVLGFSTVSVPLSSILPQGVAGCTLWVSPDLLVVYLPSGGSLTTQLAIPNSVALAGQLVHQQVVPIELDAVGNLVALTSTKALTLTIGAF